MPAVFRKMRRAFRQLVQPEMVLFKFQQAFVPHFAQLFGEGAAVQVEVIGHLLAVEGHVELQPARLCRLRGKVGQQAAAYRFGCGAEDALGKAQALAHGNGQQVAQQSIPHSGGHSGVGKDTGAQQQHGAVLGGNGIHHQCVAAEGIGLGEGLPGGNAAQDAFGTPEIEVLDVDGALHHHADLLHPAPGAENDGVLCKCFLPEQPGGGKGIQISRRKALEQRRRNKFHEKNPRFVVMATEVLA